MMSENPLNFIAGSSMDECLTATSDTPEAGRDDDSTPDDVLLERMSREVSRVLDAARSHAAELGRPCFGTDHLLVAMAEHEGCAAQRVLTELGIAPDSLRQRIAFVQGEAMSPAADDDGMLTPRLRRVLENANQDAVKRGQAVVTTLNLLTALLREREGIAVLMLEVPGVGLERAGGALALAFREGWTES